MSGERGPGRRVRGAIDRLPSGQYRVRVYAGIDPLTGKRHSLIAVVPTAKEAEKLRTRFLNEIDEQRNPRTRATVNQLLDRYLEVADVDDSTRAGYEGYIRRVLRPTLGELPLEKVSAETLDTLYAQLRKCRARCAGKRFTEHRTQAQHQCDDRCGPHRCRPMAPATIRQIHWILSGAFDRALRWRWVAVSPVGVATPPPVPHPDAKPPTAAEAAKLLKAAWDDPDWGTLLWLAMTTGARRGELCGIRRQYVDLEAGTLTVPSSVSGPRKRSREKDTKTHQQRRIALDSETVQVIRQHLERVDARATMAGVDLDPNAYLFSLDVDCSTPLVPDTVTQRFSRMAKRLGIDTTLHKLRHYNATELIAAGVDIRTVAGRLGHSGGGTTTLKVYAAWVSEADQRASSALANRMASLRAHPNS
jgi:integrase